MHDKVTIEEMMKLQMYDKVANVQEKKSRIWRCTIKFHMYKRRNN